MILLGVIQIKNNPTHIPERIFPQEMRTIEMYDFSIAEDRIVISGASPSCPFCGRLGVIYFDGYDVCTNCIEELKKLKRKNRRKING